jgi:nitroreductase
MLLCTDLKRIRDKNGGRLAEQVMACMDISMMAENMMLAAVDRGLATCPVHSFQSALIARLLELPETMLP